MGKALVTGATGFVGQHLVPALHADGWSVAAVVRPSGQQRGAPAEFSQVHDSLGLIANDLAGVDCVFHLAGLAHAGAQGADRAQLFNVNVDQTINLYRQAVAAGVPRFIWLSSIKVLGDVSDEPLPVDAPYRPGDDYAASKVSAEQLLLREPPGATQLMIVRPPLVYGPGVKANFLSMLKAALSGWPLPLKSATAPRAWLGVRNLVDLLLRLARHEGQLEPRLWHVRDAEQTSVHHMLNVMAQSAGRDLRQWTLPPGLAMGMARMIGRGDLAARLFLPLQVDMSATQQQLGWQPPCSQADAISEVVQWHLAQ